MRYLFLIILLAANFSKLLANQNITVKSIEEVNSTLACNSNEQPLLVKSKYGIISTTRPSNTNCSWIISAEPNNVIFIKFLFIELDLNFGDAIFIYEGFNDSYPVLKAIAGHLHSITNLTSKENVIYIKFKALRNSIHSGFELYFEQTLPKVNCTPNQIKCRDELKCVQIDMVCDGHYDCDDGTDEQNCRSNNTEYINLFANCGNPQIAPILDNDITRIVGGSAAKPGSWPWIADLRLASEEPFGAHQCAAVLINQEWILTAAHCFMRNPNGNDWRIHLGKYNKLVRDDTEIIRYVDNTYTHPNFNGFKSLPVNASFFEITGNDIALVKMSAALPLNHSFISAVCLPNLDFELNDTNSFVYVIGWGDTMNTGNSLVLKQARVPVISNELCNKWMPTFEVDSSQLCAGYQLGVHDACEGDSGGPLVWFDEVNRRFILTGIVSLGDKCGQPFKAGVYTKVSHFIDWIEYTINYYYKHD